jgi:L-alanine-DL-glutamate epimerase-like enolase superfamily enzyme
MKAPKITRVRVHQFQYEVDDLGVDYNGFNAVYEPGAKRKAGGYVVAVETDAGVTGEYHGGDGPSMAQIASFAHYLIGRNALERELIHQDLKRANRKNDRFGMGPIDCALWDLAGKFYGASVSQLLGGWKESVPCYASTYHGDHQPGGLSSPQAFADFALECREIGYPAMKIHPWGNPDIKQEVANVLAARKAVGDGFDLMLDPACEYNTFADTLKVGRACDEAGFLWLEDPMKDGGISMQAYRKLRELIRTPVMIGEHSRGFETHVDLLVSGATDLVHMDPNYDMGITGCLKIAHAVEGFGCDVQCHAPGPAQRALMSAIRNTNYYEMGLVHPKVRNARPPIYADDYRDGLDAVDKRGHVPVPQGPGLGVTYDWDWIKKNEVGCATYD